MEFYVPLNPQQAEYILRKCTKFTYNQYHSLTVYSPRTWTLVEQNPIKIYFRGAGEMA